MPAPFRQKNNETHRVVVALRKAAHAHDAAIWGSVAERIERPRHQQTPVNVAHLERLVDADEWVVVPGKVLAEGAITKAITVGAVSYSGEARAKIHAAGGKALTIAELLLAKPDGAGVRIFG
jgi:large subunit ribosomal protein L18e